MLEAGLMIIVLMVFSLIVQEKLKVPLPITLIGTVFILAHFNIHPIDINAKGFDETLLLLLPLLVMGDVLNLKTEDLKQHWRSIVATAGVAVVLSIVLGVLLKHLILPQFDIPLAAMIALMAMVVATDPVTVSAIFGNANIPHKLKFIAESESLFNDATAFAIFSVAIASMSHQMTAESIFISFSISTLGALATGALVGILGIYVLKLSDKPVTETGILLIIAYSAFLMAEQLDFASIFAIVVSMALANALITSRPNPHAELDAKKDSLIVQETQSKHSESLLEARLEHETHQPQKSRLNWMSIKHLSATKQNRPDILNFLGFAALFANVILFVSISEMINFKQLLSYWQPIVSVFIFTTLIRAFVLGQFAWVSNMSSKMQNVSVDWWAILTFAGVKGGLSILMVHMIPITFEYRELFEAIVIGNIVLSIFIYAPAMILTIKLRQKHIEM